MIKLNDVVEFIHNPLAYEQKLVSIINTKGEQILLSSFSELYNDPNSTIKVEGLEKFSIETYNKCQYLGLKYNHKGPITCHAFIAKDGAPSFPLHTDPDDVIILCVEGTKKLLIENEYIILQAGDDVYIPANTPHQAFNENAAFTLSFGLEKFLKDKAKLYNELDVLPKND
jgi:mannose-6-phosphate isomerase-like protein (cupin superfamily)